MQRGQAFDALKLLLAAVIAGVILVLLLTWVDTFSLSDTPKHSRLDSLLCLEK